MQKSKKRNWIVFSVCAATLFGIAATHTEHAHKMSVAQQHEATTQNIDTEKATPPVEQPTSAEVEPEVKSRTIVANCSAYTASADETGGNGSGVTASGTIAEEGRTVAMDDVPFGTIVRIDGHDYIVEDRFGGGYTNRIDIYMDSKHDALQFGRQYLEVEIIEVA